MTVPKLLSSEVSQQGDEWITSVTHTRAVFPSLNLVKFPSVITVMVLSFYCKSCFGAFIFC